MRIVVSSELGFWPAALEIVAVGDFLVLVFFWYFLAFFNQSSSGARLRRQMSRAVSRVKISEQKICKMW
jgi:hypothetical protein